MITTRTVDEALASVHRKLAAARRAGAVTLGPPLAPDALAAIEARIGVELPEGFRRFLLEIGDGGRGPQFTLNRLEGMLAESRKTIYTLADPFEPALSSVESVALEAPGILLTDHEGCAYWSGLVLAGDERGTMWQYGESGPGWTPHVGDVRALITEDGTPFVPVEGWGDDDYYAELQDLLLSPRNRHLRLTFLDWYERFWLDPVLPRN